MTVIADTYFSSRLNSCFRALTVLRAPGTIKVLSHIGNGQLKDANNTCCSYK